MCIAMGAIPASGFSVSMRRVRSVAAARAAYKLPYFHSHMEFQPTQEAIPEIDFNAQRDDPLGVKPANAHIRYRAMEGIVTPAAPGSLEHFLIERYILYSADDEHQLYRARVHHQPYPVQRADLLEIDETLIWAAGIRRPRHIRCGITRAK